MGTGSFSGVKRPGRDVDHPSPSSAEVKEKVALYPYSPFGPSWPVLARILPLPFTRYLYPLPLPFTFTLYPLPLPFTFTLYLYPLPLPFTFTLYLYPLPLPFTFTFTFHLLNRKLNNSQSQSGRVWRRQMFLPCQEQKSLSYSPYSVSRWATAGGLDNVRCLNTLVFSEIREVEKGDQSLGQCNRELITEMASCDSSETKANSKHHYHHHKRGIVRRICLISTTSKLKREKERNRTIE